MLEETLIAGFGGQGVLIMGRILAQAAMQEGLNATWLPSYGPEMRGGTANCIVVFSDDEIGSPVAAKYDAVVAMNQPSLEKFEPTVRSGGTLVINRSIVPIPAARTDLEVHYIAANELAEQETQAMRSANIVALGSLHGCRPRLRPESLEAAIAHVFERKGSAVVATNLRALRVGIDAIEAVSRSPG